MVDKINRKGKWNLNKLQVILMMAGALLGATIGGLLEVIAGIIIGWLIGGFAKDE